MVIKKFGCLLSAALMLALALVQAFAGEMGIGDPVNMETNIPQEDAILSPVETEKLGSITIKLEDSSKNIPKGNVALAVVPVADVLNGEFVLLESFADISIDLNQIRTVEELEETAEKLQAKEVKQKTILTTDDSGTASISDLQAGVYLIYAVDTARYDSITSALVSIPTFDEEAGVMEHDIEIFPKRIPVPEDKIGTPVKTGVEDHVLAYEVALGLSFAAVVFLMVKAAGKEKRAD